MKNRPTAVGYVRVSTTVQANEGVSLEAQRARIEAWAVANGVELLSVHVDAGIGGAKVANRPALQKALAEASKRKAALVAYSLSRIARSTRDALDIAARLEKAGADLVSLSESVDTTTATGRAFFGMIAVMAQMERDLISERTTSAMAHLRRQGRRVSGWAPFGYRFTSDGKSTAPVEAEQATLREIRTRREAGETLAGIAEALKAAGIRAKRGGGWTPATVRRILLRMAPSAA